MEWTSILLVLGGAGAGFINAVAGGGSALVIPILMLSGVDASVANGTNRLVVGANSLAASSTYHFQGIKPWGNSVSLVVVIVGGTILGASFATRVPADQLEIAFGVVFVVLAFLLGLKPGFLDPGAGRWSERKSFGYLGIFLCGVYGGVLQAGVGVPLLLVLVNLFGFDAIHSNAIKSGMIFLYSTIVVIVFDSAGLVDWERGLWLVLGGVAGSVLGARAVVTRGQALIRIVTVTALLLAAVKCFGIFE